jgi:hypothetical protein
MMALASDNRAIGQRDRSNVAFAAILLLHCGVCQMTSSWICFVLVYESGETIVA